MIEDTIKNGRVSIGKTGFYLRAETEQGFSLNMKFVNLPDLMTIGISNITKDQEYVLFADYDRISVEDLKKQISYIFSGCNGMHLPISHILVITTGKDRYHLICFEKFKLDELKNILNKLLCDYAYKSMPIKIDKGWILRIKPKVNMDSEIVKGKPEYFAFYVNPKSVKPERKLSRAHYELFSTLYPEMKDLKVLFHNNDVIEFLDDNESVKLIEYGTFDKNFLTLIGLNDLQDSKRLVLEFEKGEE